MLTIDNKAVLLVVLFYSLNSVRPPLSACRSCCTRRGPTLWRRGGRTWRTLRAPSRPSGLVSCPAAPPARPATTWRRRSSIGSSSHPTRPTTSSSASVYGYASYSICFTFSFVL